MLLWLLCILLLCKLLLRLLLTLRLWLLLLRLRGEVEQVEEVVLLLRRRLPLRYPSRLHFVQRARVERARFAEFVVRVLAELAEVDQVVDDRFDVFIVHGREKLKKPLVNLIHVGEHLLECFVVSAGAGF